MYPDGEELTKNAIKKFMRNHYTAITPDIVTKYIYRCLSVEEAQWILDDMVKTEKLITKTPLADGSYTYYYKYKKKKRYY